MRVRPSRRPTCGLPWQNLEHHHFLEVDELMAGNDSITRWIEGAKQGEEEALQALWERYFDKLVRFARSKLESGSRRVEDEEDVALSAFKSFCMAARAGRFPDLKDRDGLWRLLLSMTARKAVDLKRYVNRQKRRVLGETAIGPAHAQDEKP